MKFLPIAILAVAGYMFASTFIGEFMRLYFVIVTFFYSVISPAVVTPDLSKPKALIQEIKVIDDTKKLVYPAYVDAKINSIVTADLDGHIKKVLKGLGGKVKAGEVVLYLENKDPAFTFSAVPVRAPVAGVISQVNFQMMSRVAKGEKLFTVMNAETLKISVEVPASEMSQLSPGSKGKFRLNMQNENPIPIQVVGLSPVIDPRSGTASAEIEFLKPLNMALPPVGTVGQVVFEVSSGKVILLAENSLSYVEGQPTVRVIDQSNKSHRRIVQLGEQREDLYVIKGGLKSGDRVIIRANRPVKDNEEVEIQAPEKK